MKIVASFNASYLAYSSTTKLETTYFPDTPVDFQRNAQRYTAVDDIPHKYCYEDLRSHKKTTFLNVPA
jgi:hypothetical protein